MNGYFPSEQDLSNLCTSNCLSSLQDLRSQQIEGCTAEDIITTGGQDFPPTFTLDQLIFTYNYTCITDEYVFEHIQVSNLNHCLLTEDRSSKFCAPQIENWLNSSTGMTAAQNCSTCFLSTLQTELGSYFGYDDELAEEFSSLTSSCLKTNYPVTSPPVYTIAHSATASISVTSTFSSASSSATPTVDCAEDYTIQAGDTCYSIGTKFNSSTHGLLYKNNLPAYCVGFPSPGTTLCIPEACDIYTVQGDDTCYSIMFTHDYAFTVTQLISWNPNLNRGCSNINQLVGSQICLSFEKGAVPTISSSTAITTAPVPTDLANGTNTRCAKYHQVATNETCSSMTVKMGINPVDFYFLNSEVNSTSCNNLIPGDSYCVKAVGDISTYSGYGGTSQTKCIHKGTIVRSCLATTTLPTDTYWDFPSPMNATSTSTSVSAYSTLPVASGTVSSCAQYEKYYNPGPNRSNTINTCDYIAHFIGITVDELLQLNPSLSYNDSNPSACSLQKGYRYCVRRLKRLNDTP